MAPPIEFYNTYTKNIETEAIYGERFLRWGYERMLGRMAVGLLIKRALFSRWYGWRMSQPSSRARIAPFIEKYGIDCGEMSQEPKSYESFNAFFARRLQPSARPICPKDQAIVFPADGRHMVIPKISALKHFYVKGVTFDLAALLRDQELGEKFADGAMLISRLCPVDYHRFHFPCAGVPEVAHGILGPLYSVSPLALRRRPTILWENKRTVTSLRTESLGEVLLLEVGATCVGTIQQTFQPRKAVSKGEEKGYFLFGGSCCITLFEPGGVRFSDVLLEHSAQQREVYAHMGDEAGIFC
ncbi:MAG: phosphatidylserine decarboxylase [Roseimicrobium sp.]